ncbi:hypothetical protein OOJ91_34305 [Micromonospora lupini]|uniref:hypothetical protein n=1 Tax=Micromonospora lupini TaxID=285679 RepID=UPI0022515891|nr:hypothetical protein [Micromonospora lupini]MCX5070923.1 hypothetical protein [Micromonospora lupini]
MTTGHLERLFALDRHTDVTGVSGAGVVAYGVETTDGTVIMRWLGDRPSTVIWESIQHALAVHGHDGATTVVTLAGPIPEDLAPTVRAAFSRILAVAGVVGQLAEDVDRALTQSGPVAR